MNKENDIISRLYKAAKKHDADILKHFNDEDLSDQNYFLYAMNEEIMSNTICIILNMSLDNLETINIDRCCRGIIEAITLIELYNQGKISDLQLEIYRYSYALVEVDNYFKILKKTGIPVDEKVAKDKETALNLFAKHFGIARSELDGLIKSKNKYKRIYLADPLAFLYKKPNDKIEFVKLITNYLSKTFGGYYTFFSIFDHPRYEEDLELEASIQKIRFKFIFGVINLVINYFNANKLFLADDEYIPNESQDIFEGENAKENKTILGFIEFAFSKLIDELAIYDEKNTDGQCLFYLNKLRCFAKSLYISMHFGYKEQVISSFKPFAELSSVINLLNTFSVDEFYILREAFITSSRYQLYLFANNVLSEESNIDNVESSLKELYEKYYKDKYKLNDFEKFKLSMRYNSLYFLNKESKNYKAIVNKAVDVIFNDPTSKDEFLTAYNISIDVSHANGYSFNASPGIMDVFSRRIRIMFYKYVFQYAFLVAETKKEHGYNVNIDVVLETLKKIIDEYEKEFDETYK